MDERYLRSVDYPAIIARLAEHTSFSASRKLAENLAPSSDAETVQERLEETTEAKALLSVRPDVTVGGARDVRPLVQRAALDAALQPSDLLVIQTTLMSCRTLRSLLTRLSDEYPRLARKAEDQQPLSHVIDEIGRCLDSDGNVYDDASPELARIRREAALARDRVVDRLHRIVSSERNAPYLQEPIVTERNGRYVIPLKSEFKGRISGIIHDQSSSGATLFIEPLETVELNNRWHQLRIEERHEVERILRALSRMVGEEELAITRNVEVLAEIDLALAKARYSIELHARPLDLCTEQWPTAPAGAVVPPAEQPLYLARARHPLLPADSVVPIDVYAGGSNTALVVTGPNTGGKTVALKTVGLLSAMCQAGMHVPAMEGSRLPVFSGIYADIGDEQSIEQSLSTFSSHLSRIVDILGRADAHSLVLLDELGAGTDPTEGSALAQALLDAFLARGSLLLASTHYSQLKIYAYGTARVENASVEFDVETLSPTYRMIVGIPGRSNAFAIAERLGLSQSIIDDARALLSGDDVRSEALLENVVSAKERAERALAEEEHRLAQVRSMERELCARLENIEEARRQVLEEAREEGRRELANLRTELKRILAELLPTALNPSAAGDVARHLRAIEERLAPVEALEEGTPDEGESLHVGDTVYVTSLKQKGEILSLGEQEAEVKIGGFRLRTHPSKLRFEARATDAAPSASRDKTARIPRAESPGVDLDMRGWRAHEVAPALDKYLDQAYLAGLPWVNIIHGKGMGVLRQVVREFLQGHPLVESARPGAQGEGGDGVTVARLHSHRD